MHVLAHSGDVSAVPLCPRAPRDRRLFILICLLASRTRVVRERPHPRTRLHVSLFLVALCARLRPGRVALCGSRPDRLLQHRLGVRLLHKYIKFDSDRLPDHTDPTRRLARPGTTV